MKTISDFEKLRNNRIEMGKKEFNQIVYWKKKWNQQERNGTTEITTEQQSVLEFVIWQKTNLQRKRATLLSLSLGCTYLMFEKNDVDFTGNSYDVTKLLSFVSGLDSHFGIAFVFLPFEWTTFFHATPELRSPEIPERPFKHFIILLDLHALKRRNVYNFHGPNPGRTT